MALIEREITRRDGGTPSNGKSGNGKASNGNGNSHNGHTPGGLESRVQEAHAESSMSQINTDLLGNVLITTWKWWAVLGLFATMFTIGLVVFLVQLYEGMGLYGNNAPGYWALPIINFVFWAGVALSGTMISAILRLFHAGWRRSLTRLAETLTICALAVAGIFPLLHIGRNWCFYWMVPYPNNLQLWPDYRSPLIWDATALSVYLVTSALFWLTGIVPDWAVLRDRTVGWRHILFGILALGWRGTDREWRRIKTLFTIMTVLIIPVFVSLHTIVGYDFGMSLTAGWHNNIYAPYFVCGALYSGAGAVLVVMALVRRGFHLEKYILPMHFDNIGKVLFAISLLWFSFFAGDAWGDYLTRDPNHTSWIYFVLHGYKYVLWTILIFGIIIPFSTLGFGKIRRNPWAMLAIGVCVNVAMFTERIVVVIPPASANWLVRGNFTPTISAVAICIAAYGLFGMLYTLLTKFIPIVSLWEYKEGEHAEGVEMLGNGDMPVTVREEAIA